MPTSTDRGTSLFSARTDTFREPRERAEASGNEGGLLSRLFAWLGGGPSNAPATASTPSPTPARISENPRDSSFAARSDVRRYSFTQAQLESLTPFSVSAGDVVAVDFSFEGELGERLWKQIEQNGQKLGSLLQAELDAEFGSAWENMVTIYRGSTHINIVLHSNDGEEPKKSIFQRAWISVKKAMQSFVSFANDLWPQVKAVGCWIKKVVVQFLELKHAADDLATLFGFRDARSAAKKVVAWVLGLWGLGPGFA